jgi:SAM-dependent methyltransferase
LAKELIVADLNPNCIKKTKEKLGDHVSKYFVCDGKSIPFVGGETQDLVFSYDSFVHMHKNVIDDYLSEINRVLVDGGKGIIHHSNLLGGNNESFKNWAGRSNMGGDMFKELVEKHGMVILEQKKIKVSDTNGVNWSGVDLISIFQKKNKIS